MRPVALDVVSDEARNRLLQQSLSVRRSGGPQEQTRSKPSRLRNTRSCCILDSSLEEPLTYYKGLEPVKPHWPHSWRRLHLTEGIRVRDMDTVVVPSRDCLTKTKKGMLRSSSGTVTYSSTHAHKVELDAQALVGILQDGVPGGRQYWTPPRLAVEFQTRTGRSGVWKHYEIGINTFLLVFPKTFDLFGPSMEFVRLHRQSCQMLLDHIEDAMTRLAMCRQDCRVHYNIADKFYEDPKDKWAEQMSDLTWAAASPKATLQPQLKQHRLKAAYVCADTSITSQRTTSPAARSRGLGFGSLSHAEA